jgi:biotin carboxylase
MKFLVIDIGMGWEHARRLAEGKHDVFLTIASNLSPTPRFINTAVGYGFEGITKTDFGNHFDDVDCIVFTDIGFGYLVDYLRNQGKVVFGTGSEGEKLEVDRIFAKKVYDELGIKYPETYIFHGLDALADFFETHEGKWVLKVNTFRGDIETQIIEEVEEADAVITGLMHKFGIYGTEDFKFIVEKCIDGVMVGVDTFFDGNSYVRPFHFGLEVGVDAIGRFQDTTIMDDLMMKLAKHLKKINYRGAISVEAMYDGKECYAIDICARFPYPLSMIYCEFIENYPDVILGVAKGNAPNLKLNCDEYVGILNRTIIDEEMKLWIPVFIDERENGTYPRVRFRRAVQKDDVIYIPPYPDKVVISVMDTASSVDSTLKRLEESIKCVRAINTTPNATSELYEAVINLKKKGVEF